MNNVAHKILSKLEREGELTLEEVAQLLSRKFGDHRDFYVFASLVAEGLIDDSVLQEPDRPNPNRSNTQLLARRYFAMSHGELSATYENRSWSIHSDGETLKGQTVALSGKGSLYLREIRTKRADRAFAMLSGIVVGIVVAVVAAHARKLIGI